MWRLGIIGGGDVAYAGSSDDPNMGGGGDVAAAVGCGVVMVSR